MSSFSNRPYLLVLSSLVMTSNAQLMYRRRRSSFGRVVAGCIVGALFVLFFICLFIMLRRRRRARAQFATVTPIGPGTLPPNKPMFGGPWGRPDGPTYTPHQGAPIASYSPQPQRHNNQSPYNPNYPSDNATLPPPAYDQSKLDQMSGATLTGQTSDYPYPQHPGPPPAAHTTGQNNSFVGGFKS